MLVQQLPRRVAPAALFLAAAVLLAGCTVTNPISDKIDYRSAQPTRPALDVPPELTALPPSDRFAVPGAATSASQVATQRAASGAPSGAAVVAGATAVVATSQIARIEREGQQRWLAVDLPPEQVYPVVRDFWPSVGLALERDDPTLGIFETVWSENRAKIPQDIVRRTIGRVFDSLWSTGERDRFRTRLERTPKNTTEIFISHRGMEEVYTTSAKDSTTWQPRASNPELEAEMLQRLLVRFAPAPGKTTAVAANAPTGAGRPVGSASAGAAPAAAGAVAAPAATGAAAASAAGQTQTVRLVRGEGGRAQRVEIDEPFDRAWRRVGLGLDRGAFTVEDRDRANGVFFVRYLDPEVEARQRGQQGMFSKLFGSDPKIVAPQYRVVVSSSGSGSAVTVLDQFGKPESSPTGDRILTLLSQQLR
ncbi:MAG: outer membrane protein assembly factor BamC [Burkholderiales bacterium]|nr:outer membrane protein assembly factor BamC [Burkholderiales bacterium]